MHKFLTFVIVISFCSSSAQTDFKPTVEFSSDLENFENLSGMKESLKGVEIVALGENTHGLGNVFATKTELVKFLHQELDFDLVLFESGYGDAALAWEQIDSLSTREFTSVFSSNFYYNSDEIENLVGYTKSQNGSLIIQGFDCQPQQNYLIKRMAEIAQSIDSILANSVSYEMRAFNNLYQFEKDKDTLAFNMQKERFISFLNSYSAFLKKNTDQLLQYGITKNEINALIKSNEIFKQTYSKVDLGGMISWPNSDNIRDNALFEVVKWFKEERPESKIIIWAQNSHIENMLQGNNAINWMGHNLKSTYGDKYYSIGTIVYSGINLNYNGTNKFEHDDKNYLAYYLNQVQKERYVLDLRNYNKSDFIIEPLLGMENNGNTAEFIAKDRFDGLLFIKFSDIPTLIQAE